MQVNVTEIQEFVVDYAQNHLSQDIKTFVLISPPLTFLR